MAAAEPQLGPGPEPRQEIPDVAKKPKTAADFPHYMQDLADIHYPDARKIRVVMDNLSTHTAGALYEPLLAPEVHRLLQRLEFRYAPEHVNWLNMVEIEIGVLRGQCLNRRIGDCRTLLSDSNAWKRQRNASGARIKRMFTTTCARDRLARVYRCPVKES